MRADPITFGPGAGQKWCPRCQQFRPVAAFRSNRAKVDGLSVWCRGCASQATRRWRAEHPEKVRSANEARRLPPLTRTCEGCGTQFTGRPNKLACSRRCARRVRARRAYYRRKEQR